MKIGKNFLPKYYAFGAHERDNWVSLQASSIPAGLAVLDVGAGTCRYRHLFDHCVYKSQDFGQYQGSSTNELTNDKETWGYGHIDYVCDATSIPVDDASFDVVLCTEVLEHVPDPVSVVREIGRILRPGGSLILTAPLASGLHQEPFHFYGGFTPHWYRKFLALSGFENIDITPNGGFFRHYGQESQRFSAFVDPRRLTGVQRVLLFPFWLVTLPWFRFIFPVICFHLDDLDKYRGFTVGYHVRATKMADLTP